MPAFRYERLKADGRTSFKELPRARRISKSLQLFIEVPDIDAYVAKAVSHGAAVLVPKTVLPDGDALAIVLDPAGLSFGLYSPRT